MNNLPQLPPELAQPFLMLAAHTLVFEAGAEVREAGFAPGYFRNDFSADAPAPRNIGQETRDTLQARIDLQDPTNAANRKQSFNDYQTLSDILLGRGNSTTPSGDNYGVVDLLNKVQPGLSQLQQSSQSAQRAADIGDLQKYGQQTVDALRAADPRQQALLDRLNQQATEGLDAGSGLDPAMLRQTQQSIRSGQAARGMGYGNADVSAEALYSGQAGQALKQQRQGFATQVAGINASTSADPMLALFGRPSQAGGQAQSLLGQTQAGNQASAFDPMNAYASDLYNTNYNGAAAANISTANNNAAFFGSLASY